MVICLDLNLSRFNLVNGDIVINFNIVITSYQLRISIKHKTLEKAFIYSVNKRFK